MEPLQSNEGNLIRIKEIYCFFFFFFSMKRSDVMGHILPILGRDWYGIKRVENYADLFDRSHSGVAQLYNNIYANGYKILYLSSRPIGSVKNLFIFFK